MKDLHKMKSNTENKVDMLSEVAKYKEGFALGYRQLRVMDLRSAKKELMQMLGVTNNVSFAAYREGRTEPKASQAAAVEAVFKKYGITDIWGK